MKKLMTLMFLGLAAFAGGGLMNEHTVTTVVNYLYHKQQVGNVINLGTIADTPPAELPQTLPATPGAVPKSDSKDLVANPARSTQPMTSNGAAPPAIPVANGGSGSTPVLANAPAPNSNGATGASAGATVPGTAPPPISIRWPDETVSTFRTSPNVPQGAASAAVVPPDPQSQMQEALPPPLPDSAPIAALAHGSAVPHVPPPQIQPAPQQNPQLRDDRVDRASSAESVSSRHSSGPAPSTAPVWKEIEIKMNALGVVRYEIVGSPGGKKKFRCEIDVPGAPKFEAESEDVAQAAQFALKRVVLFQAARKASGSSAGAQEDALSGGSVSKPGRMPPANALNVPRTVTPGREPSGISAAPLAPPPDLPN